MRFVFRTYPTDRQDTSQNGLAQSLAEDADSTLQATPFRGTRMHTSCMKWMVFMTQTSLCSHILHRWPGDNRLCIYRILMIRRSHLPNVIAKYHHNMPPNGRIREGDEQKTQQDTPILAENSQQTSKDGKAKASRSRTGRTSKQKASGLNSGSNSRHGDSSIQPTDKQRPFRNPLSQTFVRNNRPGNNSIHSTATSTRPSYLNNQWRTHSTQQTPPVDTEGLTQALEQLTTQDNSQDTTAPTAGPTKSRWRTAKPRQPPTSNTTTAPISTKTPSHNPDIKPNPRRPTQAATLPQQQRTSQRGRGMAIGFLRIKA